MGKISISKLKTLTGHKDCVYTLQGGHDNHFFSGAGDGMVVRWDLAAPETGHLVAKLPNSVYALCYMQQENLLAIGHNYDGIHLIECQSNKEIGSVSMTKSAIFDIKYYKEMLFVADASGTVTVLGSNLSIIKRLEGSQQSARTIALNPEKQHMAIGYSDNVVRIYSLEDFSLLNELASHTNSVFTLCYSPDYQLLLSAGRDAHLKVWDVASVYLEIQDIVAHLYAINNLQFSPDGKHFVTCSMDKSIKVWDAERFKLLKVIDKARHAGHGTSVNKLFWSVYQNQLVSASDDRTISIWDIQFNS